MNIFQSAWRIYLLAGLVALLSGMAGLAICGIYPFGAGCFTHIDNLQLFAPDFGSINRILDGSDSVFFSYSSGGTTRSSFLVMWHSLFFPTTWMAWLMPYTSVAQAASWAYLFNLVFITLAALFYFKNTFRQLQPVYWVLLALGYLFSSFVITKYTYIPFYHFMGIFPLFVYTLDRLRERGKCWPYICILGWMMAFAPYFGYMYILFAIIYSACFGGLRWKVKEDAQPRHYALLLWGTVFAIAVSCWSWLPSLILTAESCRGSYAVDYSWLYGGTLLYQNFSLWLCAPFAVALLLWMRPGMSGGWRNRYLLSFCILLVSVFFLCTYNLWHMGAPINFPGRYYFMLQFVLLSFAASRLQNGRLHCVSFPRGLLPVLLVAACALFSLGYFFDDRMIQCREEIVGIIVSKELLWLLAVTAFYVCMARRLDKTQIVLLGLFVTLLFVVQFRYDSGAYRRTEDDLNGVSLAEWADKQIKEQDAGMRCKGLDGGLHLNFAQFTQFRSVCNFFHSVQTRQQSTLSSLGYPQGFTRLRDVGGTLFSDALLGIKYYIADLPVADGSLPIEARAEEKRVYSNPFYWGFGFVTAAPCDSALLLQHDPVAVQNAFANLIQPGRDALERKDYSVRSYSNELAVEIELSTGFGYLSPSEFKPYQIAGFKDGSGRIRASRQYSEGLCRIPEGTTAILLQRPAHQSADSVPERIGVYTLNQERLAEISRTAAQSSPLVAYSGRQMQLACNNDTGMPAHLVLPLLTNGYYTAKVNGRECRPDDCMGLVSIPLPDSGKQNIVLTYTPPLQLESILAAVIAGILLLGVYYAFLVRKEYPRMETVLNRCLVLGAGILCLYPVGMCAVHYLKSLL